MIGITFKETKIGRIPGDWELLPFDDLVDKKGSTGKYHKLQTKDYLDEGRYPIIDQGQEFTAGYTNDEDDVYTGSLPVTIFGDHTLFVKFVNMEFAIGADGTVPLYPNKNKLTDKFFYYLIYNHKIKSEGYQRHLKYLKQKRFAVPPLPEQHKIAEILSTVDEAIEKTDAIIQETQQLKKGLMQKLFTEGIGHTRFKETRIGRIPEEWGVSNLSALFQVIDGDRGINYPKSDELLSSGYCVFLSAKNVTKSGFRFDEVQYITQQKDKAMGKGKLTKGDFVLTTRGTLGNFAYFDDTVVFDNLRINSGMVLLRPLNNISARFYYTYFNSYHMQKQIERIAYGTAQSQLTVGGILKFEILVPPSNEQNQIAEILSEIDAKIETEQA